MIPVWKDTGHVYNAYIVHKNCVGENGGLD